MKEALLCTETVVILFFCSHQHVLSQPALIFGNTRGDAEGKALFPKERVSSITTAKGQNLPGVRQVRY